MANLTEHEREFIKAALLDEQYEFFVDDNNEYSLFQDVEGDGLFMPSVTILHRVDKADVAEEEERINGLLEPYDWLQYETLSVEVTRGTRILHMRIQRALILMRTV